MGRLTCIHIPTPEEEQRRQRSRDRKLLVRKRSACRTSIKGVLHYYGQIPADSNRKFTSTAVINNYVKELEIQDDIKPSIDLRINLLKELDKGIGVLDKEFQEQIKTDTLLQLYLSVPGIGFITAQALNAYLGDLSRFSNSKKLSSYLGLTPSEYSSGEIVRRGHITKSGNVFLRTMLIESTWTAIRKDLSLRNFYSKLAIKKGTKKAIVAATRKYVCKIYKHIKNKEAYVI